LGGFGYSDDDMSEASDNAMQAGVITFIAAGNSGPGGNPNCRHNNIFPNQPFGFFSICSPGTSLKAITVGASDKFDNLAGFSGRGYALFANNSVSAIKPDLTAPGVAITSTVPTGSCSICDPSGYKALQGTSMATPHVSGVAALLKQAYPSWTAADIKLALINPSIDLGNIPVEQGTGRVDAFKSYLIKTLFSPNNQFLGQDTLSDNQTFQSSPILNLKNIHTQPQSYILTVNADPPGIATVNPTSFLLNPGQNALINLSYSLDNSLATTSFFYNGKINVQSQGISVPFSTFKVNLTGQIGLTLNFGPYHYYTAIFDLLPNPALTAPTGYGHVLWLIYTEPPSPNPVNFTLYLNDGVYYYLSSTFQRHPSWFSLPLSYWGYAYTTTFNSVFLNGIAQSILLDRDQATNILNYTILNTSGNPLFPNAYCYPNNWNTICNRGNTVFAFVLNESVGIGVGQIGDGSALLQFINDAPLWSLLSTHTYSTPEPATYVARNFIKPAVGSHTIAIQPSNRVTMKYKFIPGYSTLTSLFFQNWFYFNHTVYHSILDIGLHRRVILDTNNKDYENFYFTPESALMPGGTDFETIFYRLSRLDIYDQYTSSITPGQTKLGRTPFFRFPLQNIFEHILPSYPWISLNRLNITYNSIYETEKSPSIWNTKFVNLPDTIKLKVHKGVVLQNVLSSLPLIKQNNIFQPYGIVSPADVIYTLIPLFAGGTSAQGTMPDPPPHPAPLLDIPVVPGYYTFVMNLSDYDWILGIPTSFLTFSIFDTTNPDNNPPVIDFFRILASGVYTSNVLPVSLNNKIIFKADDIETSISDQKIFYQPYGSGTWIEIPVVTGVDYDHVILPNLSLGAYDLRYFIADSFNNSLEQVQSPAFIISTTAAAPSAGNQTGCGNYICEEGENQLNCASDCPVPSLSISGTANIGAMITFLLNAPNYAGRQYVLALSLGTSGILLPGGATIFLSPDPIFFASISSPYLGMLNSIGILTTGYPSGNVVLFIPNIPGLIGTTVYAAYAVVSPSLTNVMAASPTVNFTIS
ncbi:MAG: S8 family serine peptidase, partial [Nanoarchaeota archaeon]